MNTNYLLEEEKKTTTISSEEALRNAVVADYDVIIVTGEKANKMIRSLKKRETISTNWFYSIYFATFAVVNREFYSKFKNYKVVGVEENQVVLSKEY